MAIIAKATETTYSKYVMLVSTNVYPLIEEIESRRRFFPFNLIVIDRFTEKNKDVPLAFTDVIEPYDTFYPILDRLNKPVTGDELYWYAGKRRCIKCVYDNIYKVVRICSDIAPLALELPLPKS